MDWTAKAKDLKGYGMSLTTLEDYAKQNRDATRKTLGQDKEEEILTSTVSAL